MRYPASEKAEIIELVEQSHLPAKRTLDKLGIPRPRSIAGTIAIVRAGLRRWPIIAHDRTASGIASRTMSAPDHRPGAGASELSPRELAVRFTDDGTVLCLGGLGLSAAEGA